MTNPNKIITATIEEIVEKVVKTKCSYCDGYGYTSEHDPLDPHIDGCSNCPIQVQCEYCHGEGEYITVDRLHTALDGLVVKIPTSEMIEANGMEGGLRDNELQMFWEGAIWMRNYIFKTPSPTQTEKSKGNKCIDFAEWILIEGFEQYSDNGMCWWGKFNDETDYSTEQLYTMWLNTTPTEKGENP